jgi:hypothetical protein
MPTLRLCVQQLVPELIPVAVGGRLLDNNLFPVIGNLIDDVFRALAELEFVEGADALRCNANPGVTVSGERRGLDIASAMCSDACVDMLQMLCGPAALSSHLRDCIRTSVTGDGRTDDIP